MSIKLGVVMDPISYKDGTFAILLEASRRGWVIYYMEQKDLFLKDEVVSATMRQLKIDDKKKKWSQFSNSMTQPLHQLDVVFMRKDPPFNMDYIYTTYLLELAERRGVLVINKPQSLRDANEKLFTTWFPQCMVPTLVTSNEELLLAFIHQERDIIVKPLDGMGGQSIFRIKVDDPNKTVILEMMTRLGERYVMAQRYIPDVIKGDKRILMINGEPVPYALARIPQHDEIRANLAAGGKGIGVKITERDRWICKQVGSTLRKKGLIFVGLDVIGDYLTEINVTSPTCIREIDAAFNINIGGQLLDFVEKILNK